MIDPIPDDRPASPWQRLPRRTLMFALSVLPLVALANIAVLIWSLGGQEVAWQIAAPEMLGIAAGLALVPMLANALRIGLWSRFLDLGLGFRGGLKVVTGTMVANSITPTAAGGVPIKVLFLMGEGVSARRAATMISLQTAEDAVVMSSLVAACLAISGFQLLDFLAAQPGLIDRIQANLALAGVIAAGVLVAVAVLITAVRAGVLGHRLRTRAQQLARRGRRFAAQVMHDWLGVLQRGKGVALANLLLALIQWLARFSIAGIVLAGLGQEWHPALYWLLQYLVQSISSVVPTPGGAGGAEAGFLLLFAPFVAAGALVPAMSGWRLIFYYLPLIGAALLFFLLHRADRRRHDARDPAAIAPLPVPLSPTVEGQPAE